MKKYQVGLFALGCFVLGCSELRRLETTLSKLPEQISRPPRDSSVALSSFTLFPVVGKTRRHVISHFGDARDQGARLHEGIDIEAPKGTSVVAVAGGTVTKVTENGNGGKQVWLRDRNRLCTYYYAHLDSQMVTEGQRVEEGDELGTVGNTGNAAKGDPHLHFGVYEFWSGAVDPLPLMP